MNHTLKINEASPCTASNSIRVERLVYRTDELREALGGISRVTLWRLEKANLIRPVPGLGGNGKLYAKTEVERYLAGQTVGRN